MTVSKNTEMCVYTFWIICRCDCLKMYAACSKVCSMSACFLWEFNARVCFRLRSGASERLRPTSGLKKEEKVSHGFHEPSDLWTGEAILVPEILVPRGQRPDCTTAGSDQRSGHHLVPEQAGETQERLGGDESRRWVAEENPTAGSPEAG